MPHMYFPSVGQADKAARSAALGTTLVPETLALEPRYASRITTLPCVIIDHGGEIAVIAEPTTIGALTAAHDTLLANYMPSDVPRVTDVVGQITTHSGASNPHGITPAGIGAATSGHTHTLIDADIPAAIARDAEVAAAYATLAHTHAIDAAAGVMRKTANQTMTLTGQTAVTDMAFAVAANATYYFAMTVRVTTSSGTAPTTAWGFTGPASPTAVAIAAEQDVSTTQETKGLLTAFGALAAGAQVANTGAEFRGVVQTSAGNAGTVALTVARAGTTPSMVIPLGCSGFWIRTA